jgi:hypothetical protein
MSDEVKPQATIDTLEFDALLIDLCHWSSAFTRGERGAVEGLVSARRALIAHIDAWGARLAGEAAKDAKRLDFMIDEQCQIDRMDRPGSVPLYRVRWPWTEEEYRFWSGTGRDAIDAAIEAKEAPCGS